jgi:hypothetical protein
MKSENRVRNANSESLKIHPWQYAEPNPKEIIEAPEREKTDLGGREFFLERIHRNSANFGVLLLK